MAVVLLLLGICVVRNRLTAAQCFPYVLVISVL